MNRARVTKSINHGGRVDTKRHRGANRNWWHPCSNFTPFQPHSQLKQTKIYSPAWAAALLDCLFPPLPLPGSPFLHIYSQAHQELREALDWQSYFTYGAAAVWEFASLSFSFSLFFFFFLSQVCARSSLLSNPFFLFANHKSARMPSNSDISCGYLANGLVPVRKCPSLPERPDYKKMAMADNARYQSL